MLNRFVVGVVFFIVCIFCTSWLVLAQDATPVPVPSDGGGIVVSQPPATTTADPQTVLKAILAMAVTIQALINVAKPTIAALKLSDEAYVALLNAIAVALGMAIAFLSNQQLNLFSGLPLIPPLFGVLLTGAVAGGGAPLIHGVFDSIYAWRDAKVAETLLTQQSTPINKPLQVPGS